jgi:HD-GYP domain-containing protein (c-di-GMP phosphodiesterase class II)
MTFSHYEKTRPEHPLPPLQMAEVFGMFSYALDMTEGQPSGHSLRSTWVGAHVAQAIDMPIDMQSELFFSIVLKDIGCSSNAAPVAKLFQTDDITFKRDYKTVDGSLRGTLQFVLNQTARNAGFFTRMKTITKIATNTDQITKDLITTRCERGARIAQQLQFSDRVADGIAALDEHWDGSGAPKRLRGKDIPQAANIALLSQVVDVFHSEHGATAAIEAVTGRSGTWFDPILVKAFVKAADDPAFWLGLRDRDIATRVFALPGAQQTRDVHDDFLDDVAAAFAQVVDAKSPFTADHSSRTAFYADLIAEEIGLSRPHRRWLYRASLLHDLGKLAVSNRILDKAGKLNEEEWTIVRAHPFHSERLLKQITAFQDIASIAGAHHERLDGRGYPYGIGGNEIALETRILTVADVFDALSAHRPYRDALPINDVLAMMDRDIDRAFDGGCVAALKSGLHRIKHRVA